MFQFEGSGAFFLLPPARRSQRSVPGRALRSRVAAFAPDRGWHNVRLHLVSYPMLVMEQDRVARPRLEAARRATVEAPCTPSLTEQPSFHVGRPGRTQPPPGSRKAKAAAKTGEDHDPVRTDMDGR